MDGLTMSGSAARVSHLVREKEEKRAQERRRNLIYLAAAFLEENGYTSSSEMIVKEAQLSKDIQVCDNIDLETILQEYSEYYYVKFNKYPKICKKVESAGNLVNSTNFRKDRNTKNYSKCENPKTQNEDNVTKASVVPKTISMDQIEHFGPTVKPIFPDQRNYDSTSVLHKEIGSETTMHSRFLSKPVKDLYPAGSEWQEIAEIISKEIVTRDVNVHWDDIIGLDDCKDSVKEAIVYPLKYSEWFTGKFGTWRGILLYGPPGTGKTMLAKAVATECHSTFFNITCSSIVSKWRGDSEKYVRVLMDLAHYYAPSVIFIDEIDWIASGDSNNSINSEPARRFRAELLTRLDGLLTMENSNVLLLAATNVPWSIDMALLRRLEKRIYVDLPDLCTREVFLEQYLHPDHEGQLDSLLNETKGYSFADLKSLCREAWMNQMKSHWNDIANNKEVPGILKDYIIKDEYFHEATRAVVPTGRCTAMQYKSWREKNDR